MGKSSSGAAEKAVADALFCGLEIAVSGRHRMAPRGFWIGVVIGAGIPLTGAVGLLAAVGGGRLTGASAMKRQSE